MKRGKSIRTRYVLVILFMTLLLLAAGFYICSRSYQLAYEDHLSTAMSDFENSYSALASFQGRMNHLATIIQYNSSLVDMLSEAQDYTVDEYRRTRRDLIPMLFSMMDGSGDYMCRIYVNSSLDLVDRTSRILLLDDIQQEPWAQQILHGWGWWNLYSAGFLGSDKPAFLAPIRDLQHTANLVALLRIDIEPEALSKLIFPIQSNAYAGIHLIAGDGDVVVSAGLTEPMPSIHYPALGTLDAYKLNVLQDHQNTVYYQVLEGSEWQVITVVDHQALQSMLLPKYLYFTGFGILLVLLGMLVAMPILGSMLRRIRQFHSAVANDRALSITHVTPEPLAPGYPDEIGQLIEAHNHMMARIGTLVEERDRQEKELSRLEIQALQAQIKPHFLYNTLDSVIWMARLNEPDKVESTLKSLTSFYRLCLSKGSDTLSLDQELEICKHYFAIANARYHSNFTLEIEVEDAVLPVALPKITLQPLVENALTHGLMESDLASGYVRIGSRHVAGQAQLIIADNGAHFSRDTWEHIHHGDTDHAAGEGYGLFNVERRLCLYFGRDQVLELEDGEKDETRIILPLYVPVAHTS